MKKLLLLTFSFFMMFSAIAINTPIIDSIPMRDGKKLACDIFLPSTGGQQYPVILVQTPYNRIFYRYYLPLGIGLNIANSNFAIVTVDWRGFYGSAGAWALNSDKGKDGYDCVEWIAQQAWCDGNIGTHGASALGKIQFQTAKENPPHLKCIVPLVAGSQYEYQEYYQGGVLRTEYVNQLDSLGFGMGNTIRAHQVYDFTWAYADTAMMYPEKIKVPAFMIGGWYDHNVPVMFELFDSLRLHSPLNVRDKHRMMFGPWSHSHVGAAAQGQLQYPQAAGWSDSQALRCFDYYLRNIQNGWDTTAYIKYFQMGENTWQHTPSWPPAGTTPINLYLSGGSLSSQLPASSNDSCNITYDPRDPSPSIGGATLDDDLLQGPCDQAPVVESRNDIVTFSSDALGANVVLKGKPVVHLFVTSNCKDSDFAVRLTDVYPDGRSMLLSEGVRRLRFRNGYKAVDTSMIVPGTIYPLTIDLTEMANTFLAGHKIRVDISSSDYTRFDCNLNNGGAMYTAGDTIASTNTVYTNSIHASYIEMPLIDFTGSINEIKQENKLHIFPNPANDNIYLDLSSDGNDQVKVTVSTINGSIVRQFPAETIGKDAKQLVLDIHELPGGVYLLKAQYLHSGLELSGKIVVVK